MRRTHLNWLLVLAACALLHPPSLASQSILLGTISGTVTSGSDGVPLARALVSLTALDAAMSVETTTDEAGRFAFDVVPPGTYEVRVEVLGFRPLLARTLSVSGGEDRALQLTLAPAPPPVLTVDTLTLGGASAARWTVGGVHFGSDDLNAPPSRFGDLASATALSSRMDASLGSQGLPGSMTLVVADGVPFYRAPHPLLRGEHLPDALFPRSALSGVTVFHAGPDVEWAGSAGGYVALGTRTGTRGLGPELEGAWSGDPLWSSGELDLATPSLVSYEGAARVTLAVSPDVSSLVLAAEALQHEVPLAPRLPQEVTASLGGLDQDLVASLSAPSTERVTRYSGLARFDVHRSATSRIFLRGAAGFAKRQYAGSGPVGLGYAAALPEESVDYSFAGGFTSQSRPSLSFEIRAGVSGSSRTFEAVNADRPGAFLVGSANTLGTLAGATGESSRFDIVLLPLVRFELGGGAVKTGLVIRTTEHSMSHSVASSGAYLFSDAAALMAGRGFGRATAAPEASFTTREIGGFAQYAFEPEPGLRMSFGGRIDFELIPSAEAALNAPWLVTSGLRNDRYPSSFTQFGARAALSWDPANDGRTRFFTTASIHNGDVDPALLYQLFSQDTEATVSRFAGLGLDWPGGTLPPGTAARPTLTLLGPDARPPRSAHASAGLVREIGGGVSVHVGGSIRRTDFLMRRRNLNLTPMPRASDVYGRDVFGTLAQDGTLVTATDPDVSRFPAFAEVWALDPDGWSEYKSLSVGFERRSGKLDLYASYTLSETRDNWVGAARGLPGAALPPLLPEGDDWTEGRSDFDVPHRVSASAVARARGSSLSVVYHFRSGLPFTPGYRMGVDANGDGSFENDVAVVPDGGQLGALEAEWPCLASQAGGFARRNSCRGHVEHSVGAQLRVGLGSLGGREVSLLLEGFNLLEGKGGVVDESLLLVDPAGSITSSPDGSTVTVPVTVNPAFGRVLYPSTRGRMLRVGLRIG